MNAEGNESLSRMEGTVLVAELIAQETAASEFNIYQETRHIVALQQPETLHGCEGRYAIPGLRQGFSNIGRLVVLPAATPLEVRTPRRPDEVVRCMFTPEVFNEYADGHDLYDPNVLAKCLNLRHPGLANLLTQIGGELRSPGLASAVLTESLGLTLIIQLARFVRETARPAKPYRGGLSPRHLRLITEAVEGETNCPTLSDLSQLSGFSLRHLTRAFKQSTGLTVHEYIEQVRLEKAKRLLTGTDLMLKDIAARLGFRCSSSFSVAFRRLTGESPVQFRKRNRSGAMPSLAMH